MSELRVYRKDITQLRSEYETNYTICAAQGGTSSELLELNQAHVRLVRDCTVNDCRASFLTSLATDLEQTGKLFPVLRLIQRTSRAYHEEVLILDPEQVVHLARELEVLCMAFDQKIYLPDFQPQLFCERNSFIYQNTDQVMQSLAFYLEIIETAAIQGYWIEFLL